MYKQTFGTKNQIQFSTEAEYYELLGYLTKNDGSTVIVWEPNDRSGAWGQEGRILFFQKQPKGLRANLSHTAGVGLVLSRVNCNEMVENLKVAHNFKLGENQDVDSIRKTVPDSYLQDFENGRKL